MSANADDTADNWDDEPSVSDGGGGEDDAGRNTPSAKGALALVPAVTTAPPLRRFVVGLLSSAPILGGLAAYSTLEVAQEGAAAGARGGVGRPAGGALRRGALRGALRWLPFGVGSALFYALEYEARALAYLAAAAPAPVGGHVDVRSRARAAIFGQRAPPHAADTQYARFFGAADAARERASPASRALAGGGAALATLLGLRAVRYPGVGSLASIAGLSAGCALAAVAMPAFEDIERRFAW